MPDEPDISEKMMPVEMWPDLKDLTIKFIYIIAEDERGMLSRCRMALQGGSPQEMDIIRRYVQLDVARFIEQAKKGEVMWEL